MSIGARLINPRAFFFFHSKTYNRSYTPVNRYSRSTLDIKALNYTEKEKKKDLVQFLALSSLYLYAQHSFHSALLYIWVFATDWHYIVKPLCWRKIIWMIIDYTPLLLPNAKSCIRLCELFSTIHEYLQKHAVVEKKKKISLRVSFITFFFWNCYLLLTFVKVHVTQVSNRA